MGDPLLAIVPSSVAGITRIVGALGSYGGSSGCGGLECGLRELPGEVLREMLQAKMSEAGIERRRFTVEEYYRLAETGIPTEEDRVEPIEGEIVRLVPIGSSHQPAVDRIAQLLWALERQTYSPGPASPSRASPCSVPARTSTPTYTPAHRTRAFGAGRRA